VARESEADTCESIADLQEHLACQTDKLQKQRLTRPAAGLAGAGARVRYRFADWPGLGWHEKPQAEMSNASQNADAGEKLILCRGGLPT
jgi:hypothetical protein